MFGTKKIAGAITKRAGKVAYDASVASLNAAGINSAIGTPKAEMAMEAAMRSRAVTAQSTARKIVYGGGAAVSASVATASRPNANQSRTSYRGPMQTGRGSGRYA